MAENTRLDVRILCLPTFPNVFVLTGEIGTSTPSGRQSATSSGGFAESDDCLMRFAFLFEDTPLCHIWQSLSNLASARIYVLYKEDIRYGGTVLYAR